jgi:hypothetical protein
MATGGDAKQKVQAPAIALMAAGGLNVLAGCYNVVVNGFLGAASSGVPTTGLSKDQQQTLATAQALGGTTAVILGVLILIVAAVIIFGGLQMMKLKSYGLAMTSAILAVIPCVSCCITGIPIGVWAIIVLLKPEVKSAFS